MHLRADRSNIKILRILVSHSPLAFIVEPKIRGLIFKETYLIISFLLGTFPLWTAERTRVCQEISVVSLKIISWLKWWRVMNDIFLRKHYHIFLMSSILWPLIHVYHNYFLPTRDPEVLFIKLILPLLDLLLSLIHNFLKPLKLFFTTSAYSPSSSSTCINRFGYGRKLC